ncbi:hypothetical protein CCACVL1_29611 [Corchorus capsularis]|uniref:non-specific serine/threonine protein kinase n=1 Tax=Corchorus capsularis TaxID=210143 RepID=A0A1R3G0Z2_COCAP|nr:hypothetical protein CCACVL1_29611 [Corchorus capsularis]
MNFSASFFSIISSLFFFFLVALRVSSADDVHFASCAPFDCGNLPNISYPFWTDHHGRPAYCGFNNDERYKVKCTENQPPVVTISSQEFQLLHINQSFWLMTIQRPELGEDTICPKRVLIDDVFNYSDTTVNMTLSYGNCRSRAAANHTFKCKVDGLEAVDLLFENNELGCVEQVEIPVGNKALEELKLGKTALNETLFQPFDMHYIAYTAYCKSCLQSGGRCGSNGSIPAQFACYCPDHPYLVKCNLGMPPFLTLPYRKLDLV